MPATAARDLFQPRSELWDAVLHDPQQSHFLPGTVRSFSPEETLAKILPLLPQFGITRVANVTGLDHIGLPVYQAIRPGSRNISVSQGKGATPALAKISAIMEAIESFHAEEIAHPHVTASLKEMRHSLSYDPLALPVISNIDPFESRALDYDPFAPPIGVPPIIQESTVLDWIPATRLSDGISTWAPKQLCELNFAVEERICVPLFRATSNGLASGNTVTEALIHGLCECIERDCLVEGARNRDQAQPVILESIHSEIVLPLLDCLARARCNVALLDITGRMEVPCFEALIDDGESGISRGAGCHPNKYVAICRALTEAAQGRLAKIAGSRDDLYREMYVPRSSQRYAHFFARPAMKPVSDCAQLKWSGPFSALKDLVERIQKQTGNIPVAVDLRGEHGIPVVFVISPGCRLEAPSRKGHFFSLPVPSYRGGESTCMTAQCSPNGEQLQGLGRAPRPRVVLFFGPSIHQFEVLSEFRGVNAELVCCPPVQQGDLLRLLSDPPEIVGIIDGLFSQIPSVLHKEILLLLDRGVKVLGATSMGALRAAELDAFGMEGVGSIYRLYRDGVIDRDDEVALLHAGPEQHFKALTEPLVNVRHCAEGALSAGIITRQTADALMSAAQSLHFYERTWQAILNSPLLRGLAPADCAMLSRVKSIAPDLKHADAVLLVRTIVERLTGKRAWPARGVIKAHSSKYFHIQKRDYSGHHVNGYFVTTAAGLAFYKLFSPAVATLVTRVCRRLALSEVARRNDLQPQAKRQLVMAFRKRKGLATAEQFGNWLSRRGLSCYELELSLVERDLATQALMLYRTKHPGARYAEICRAIIADLCQQLGINEGLLVDTRFVAPGIRSDDALLRELKLTGDYHAALETAARVLLAGTDLHNKVPHVRTSKPDGAMLENWCARTWAVSLPDVPREAKRRGFLSYAELIYSAHLACLAEKQVTIAASAFLVSAANFCNSKRVI
jgi:YcaO-like protein with predicted kinase domain